MRPMPAADLGTGTGSGVSNFHLNETDAAKALVLRYHYSKRWPSAVRIVGTWHVDGGLFGDSGEAVAACVFGQPPARWGQPVLELSRLVRTPDADVSLSGLIAATTRWVKRKALADLVVSFADATVGHHGGIYQACSWNYDGQRNAAMDGVIHEGVFVPGRTATGRWGTRSPTKLAELGVEVQPHFDHGKHLYWKALTRKGRHQAASLGLMALPYPKPQTKRDVA
jgi:hypothetical protein